MGFLHHGSNVDWCDVRGKVNQLLVARQDSNADVVEAFNTRFNTMYGMKLPYRNNHPDQLDNVTTG